MGVILCPTHGMTGIATSIEVAMVDQIHHDVAIAADDVMLLTVNYYEDSVLFFTWQHLVYKATVATHGFSLHYDIYTEDESILAPLHALTSHGAICGKCFHAYKTKHGWPNISPGLEWMAP